MVLHFCNPSDAAATTSGIYFSNESPAISLSNAAWLSAFKLVRRRLINAVFFFKLESRELASLKIPESSMTAERRKINPFRHSRLWRLSLWAVFSFPFLFFLQTTHLRWIHDSAPLAPDRQCQGLWWVYLSRGSRLLHAFCCHKANITYRNRAISLFSHGNEGIYGDVALIQDTLISKIRRSTR